MPDGRRDEHIDQIIARIRSDPGDEMRAMIECDDQRLRDEIRALMQQAEITDAMVERTARAMCEQAAGADFWSGVNSDRRDHYRTLARAALTAALTPEARGQ